MEGIQRMTHLAHLFCLESSSTSVHTSSALCPSPPPPAEMEPNLTTLTSTPASEASSSAPFPGTSAQLDVNQTHVTTIAPEYKLIHARQDDGLRREDDKQESKGKGLMRGVCKHKVSQIFRSLNDGSWFGFWLRKQSSRGTILRWNDSSYRSTTLDTACSHLPAELWILIIRHATFLNPDPLDTSRAVSFMSSSPNFSSYYAKYVSSVKEKRKICLVNRSWYHFGREFLYEFVWIRRAAQAMRLATSLISQEGANGAFIRRLHIQTTALDRCHPRNLRTILELAPCLTVYSDYRSVRRGGMDAPDCGGPSPTPEELFCVLAHPGNTLRRLSWTNYDDVSFHLRILPMLEATAANLELLELNFCEGHLQSTLGSNTRSTLLAHLDTPSITLSLPSLRTLKVTLDNLTFHVLSTWSLPELQNLSVVSANFSYAGPGFGKFFEVHGEKVVQLELGHSSSMVEEYYLTGNSNNNGGANTGPNGGSTIMSRVPLASWTPNLKQFICSADAEWSWESPDWIAPHVLLPRHPSVEFIGIRDVGKRVLDDAATQGHAGLDAPYFSLLELFGSLLCEAMFPNLRYVRDLSPKSDGMRRGVNGPNAPLLLFWSRVLEKCRDRGVWLEDSDGVNITNQNLRKFAHLRAAVAH